MHSCQQIEVRRSKNPTKHLSKINPNWTKIDPWGPLGGVWGPSWPQEAPRPPQKRRPAKLGNPTWRQVGPKIHQNSIKNAIKKKLICISFFYRFLVQLGPSLASKIHPKSTPNRFNIASICWLIF